MLYSLQCWDEGAPTMVETGITFPDQEEAIVAALELACNHQSVELRRGETLIAYLRHTEGPSRETGSYIH